MGGGIFLGLAAVWFLFLSEQTWVKVVCALYLLSLLTAGVVGIFQGDEPGKWLLVFGLIAAFGVWASTHSQELEKLALIHHRTRRAR